MRFCACAKELDGEQHQEASNQTVVDVCDFSSQFLAAGRVAVCVPVDRDIRAEFAHTLCKPVCVRGRGRKTKLVYFAGGIDLCVHANAFQSLPAVGSCVFQSPLVHSDP